ncbi:hypothetical protein DAY19_01670 [Halobacteriovorax vibrionivorans]|uniref:Septum formation initiator n=1 Tax=Halobacteriovorax vibrionivorans TaxID=2152716 RepID=A0ABY0IJ41_9BACT|nr:MULTISPECIES: septum formation initiator family protein [Halobacteriovorax]RZF22504.1 hypothetical protein DAY19_01670 [Halobacteriovorax vibrionivorans]TGD47696.1 hypothetical protein EP118_07035 [Halobacteriovorax sp. Y22]
MQFSLGRNRGPASSGASTNSTSSNQSNSRSAAMQKAIERNRAKMQRRQSDAGSPPPTPGSRPSPQSRMQASAASEAPKSSGSSVLAKLREQRMAKEAQASASGARRASMSAPSSSARPSTTASAATRKPITDSNNIEMSSPLRKKTTAPAAPTYAQQSEAKSLTKPKAKVSAKRKVKSKSRKKGEVTSWGVKLCWGFCLFLLGRLIFSQGGVIEYFDKKSTLDQAYHEAHLLKEENAGLMKELELIRTNNKYKKKLVRDHLGYIARDEYLILFPENSETSVRGLSSI